APPAPVNAPGEQRPNYCDYPHLGRQGRNRTLDGKGIGIGDVAKTLARVEFHMPVLDRTGLTGTFDIHLEWTPDSVLAGAEPSEGLSIFTALREQLGLRLESSRDSAEVIVIDRVERPSGN